MTVGLVVAVGLLVAVGPSAASVSEGGVPPSRDPSLRLVEDGVVSVSVTSVSGAMGQAVRSIGMLTRCPAETGPDAPQVAAPGAGAFW